MASVPRELFVPVEVRPSAWEDRPLPIGFGQTISQPTLVGFMVDLLEVSTGSRVLDVGTGSGYQAAVLAKLGATVHSIERIDALAERATALLARLGLPVAVVCGDGSMGSPVDAPFDASRSRQPAARSRTPCSTSSSNRRRAAAAVAF